MCACAHIYIRPMTMYYVSPTCMKEIFGIDHLLSLCFPLFFIFFAKILH